VRVADLRQANSGVYPGEDSSDSGVSRAKSAVTDPDFAAQAAQGAGTVRTYRESLD